MLVGSLTICSPFEVSVKDDYIHLNTEQRMSLGDSDGGGWCQNNN